VAGPGAAPPRNCSSADRKIALGAAAPGIDLAPLKEVRSARDGRGGANGTAAALDVAVATECMIRRVVAWTNTTILVSAMGSSLAETQQSAPTGPSSLWDHAVASEHREHPQSGTPRTRAR